MLWLFVLLRVFLVGLLCFFCFFSSSRCGGGGVVVVVLFFLGFDYTCQKVKPYDPDL